VAPQVLEEALAHEEAPDQEEALEAPLAHEEALEAPLAHEEAVDLEALAEALVQESLPPLLFLLLTTLAR